MAAVPTSNTIPLSGDPLIDGLVQGGAWLDAGPVTLTYAFYVGTGAGYTDNARDVITQALDSWAAVANISFQQVAATGDAFETSNADMAFISMNNSEELGLPPNILGIGFFPDPVYVDADMATPGGLLNYFGYTSRVDYAQPEGDILLFEGDEFFKSYRPGALSMAVVIHEIGHTIGMKHPHDDGGNGRPLLPGGNDRGIETIMSYNDPVNDPALVPVTPDNQLRGYQATPMPLDILAIQSIYGVNYNYRTGNDFYLLSQDNIVKTIWDAGGTDTISGEGLSGPTTIDLRENSLINHQDGYSYTALAFYVLDITATFIVNYIENAIGTPGGDILIGNDVDNSLNGAAGSDTMTGGLGDDTYFMNVVTDIATEGLGEGNDSAFTNFTFDLTARNIENLTLTGSGRFNGTGNDDDNIITGNGTVNTLTGGLGTDTLTGGGGADTMIGGDGDDVYSVDNAKDIVTEIAGEGNDSISSKVKWTLAADVENLTLTGTAAISGTGNAAANIITGNGLKNALFGLGGNDTLIGGNGPDTLDGGTGDDDMDGGLGDDKFYVDSLLDIVREAAGEGRDIVLASVSCSIAGVEAVGVEDITLTGIGDSDATGNALANKLTGNVGNNILDGGTGADTLIGGAGNDTYVIDNFGDRITEQSGIDTVQTDLDFSLYGFGFLAVGLENLTLTGISNTNAVGNSAANVMMGNAGINTLNGATGNDTLSGMNGEDLLVGGAGSDTLAGGAGADTFLFDTAPGSQAGIDTVSDFTGGAGGDVLDLTDILPSYPAGGNVADYVQTTDSGADTIVRVDVNGLAGGSNFVQIALLTGVNLGTNEDALVASGNLILQRDDNLTGGAGVDTLDGAAGNDTLQGAGGDDTLLGGNGADILDGGTGADDMSGGRGNDRFIVDNVLDIVRENLDEGTDLASSSVDISIAGVPSAGVENVTLTGTGNINATGNALDNTLTGNAGNNVLDGGAGADLLAGGAGNDTYVIDDLGDVITEKSGIDTVSTALDFSLYGSGALALGLENLTLTGIATANGTGNFAANVMVGNVAANILDGAAGNDILSGGLDNDTLLGGEGNDTLDGGTNNDTLFGGDGNDTLDGGDDDDILVGGKGLDVLTGGLGIDTFLFNLVPGTSGIDSITDFTNGLGGDILDVADILTGYTGIVTDYVQITQVGLDSIVRVDTNGLAGGVNFVQVATLVGINVGTDEAALVVSGNLVVT